MQQLQYLGECSDEIFGGYPWFYEKKRKLTTFPWIRNLDYKESLLNEKCRSILKLKEYVMKEFDMAIKEAPTLSTDSKTTIRDRQLTYINIKYFMTNLLDRKDRISMESSLDARIHSSTQKENKLILYSKFDSSVICFIM